MLPGSNAKCWQHASYCLLKSTKKGSYALDDCMAAPIPSIIVFSGRYIRDDMKAKLISSGHGIEVGYENGAIADRYELLKQRIYIELGMNYFPFLRP